MENNLCQLAIKERVSIKYKELNENTKKIKHPVNNWIIELSREFSKEEKNVQFFYVQILSHQRSAN